TLLARIAPGAVLPSSTVLGAWQLVLAPLPGTSIRPLGPRRLRQLGFGGPAESGADPLVPPPRAVPVLVAALARGLDVGLLAVADSLRVIPAPAGCVPLGDAQLVSLAAGSALGGDGTVAWLRVAGAHIRRNGDE